MFQHARKNLDLTSKLADLQNHVNDLRPLVVCQVAKFAQRGELFLNSPEPIELTFIAVGCHVIYLQHISAGVARRRRSRVA